MQVPKTATWDANSQTQSGNPGIYRFAAVSFSQFVSTTGTALMNFSLSVWVYQTTTSVTFVSLLGLLSVLPRSISFVFTGPLVDRYGARWSIMAGNLGSALSLTGPLILLWIWNQQLELWHACVSVALVSVFQSLLWPATTSSVAILISRQNLPRVNGMLQTSLAVSGIIAPLIGGLLLLHYNIRTVLTITLATFAISMAALTFTRIPRPAATDEPEEPQSYIGDMTDAWTYLRREGTLLRLTCVFAVCTFIITIASVLLKPLVLSFAPASALGTIMAVGGIGMLLGGLAVTVSGKGATNAKQVMWLMAIAGVCMAVAGSRPVVSLIAVATLLYSFTMPVIGSGIHTIMQSSVPAHLLGRVVATTSGITMVTMPLAYPVAGPLADYVFEPLVANGGALAGTVGWAIGVGAGRGIGLLFIVLGSLIVVLSLFSRIESRAETREANALVAG